MSPKLLENQVDLPRRAARMLLGSAVAVALGLALGWPLSGEARPLNTVSNLKVDRRGDTTVVQLDARSRPLFTVYRVRRPARLNIDIAGCRLEGVPRLKELRSGAVSAISTRQFHTKRARVARIMLNLRARVEYSVRVAKDQRLVITVKPRSRGKQAAGGGKRVQPAPKGADGEADQREARLARELARVKAELEHQKSVNQAAVEAATRLRRAAVKARKRVAQLSSAEARKLARKQLEQVLARLRSAEEAREAAEKEKKRLQAALAASLKDKRAAARAAHGRASRARRSGPGPRVRDIRFENARRASRVVIDLGGAKAAYRLERRSRRAPALVLSGVRLPRLLQRTLDASEFKGPVKRITSYQSGKQGEVTVKVALRDGDSAGRVYRRDGRLVWEFPRADGGEARPKTPRSTATGGAYTYKSTRVAASRTRRRKGRKRYTGRRIDLDFKDADIHNILRLLAEVGDVNIITSDNVSGKVTIRMKNVPWDQALDVILRAKNMGMVREGNLVRVAPAADLQKEREVEIARIKQQLLLRPLETRLIPLSYAQASAVLPKIRYMMSPRGKLTFDERTNMIIARDLSPNLDLMEKLIRNLDTQTPQVLIEARIVEARTNYSREIGIQWGGNFTASAGGGNSTGIVFPNEIGIGGGATDNQTPVGGILLGKSANPNFAVNMPAATGTNAGGALGLTLGSVSGNANINLRLSAAEATGDIRIVSAPKITTLDNVEARIEQGVTIPFSQVSAAGVQTTFRDAKLNLTVKPHVTADGSIIMKISVTNNEPDFVNTGPRGEPTILKKEAQTELMVKDGETTVIGGIYTIRTGKNWQKVPWFAEIPILGYFFRYRRETSDRQEVLVFITPRIINRAQSIGR